jgi:hypothetical protein
LYFSCLLLQIDHLRLQARNLRLQAGVVLPQAVYVAGRLDEILNSLETGGYPGLDGDEWVESDT